MKFKHQDNVAQSTGIRIKAACTWCDVKIRGEENQNKGKPFAASDWVAVGIFSHDFNISSAEQSCCCRSFARFFFFFIFFVRIHWLTGFNIKCIGFGSNDVHMMTLHLFYVFWFLVFKIFDDDDGDEDEDFFLCSFAFLLFSSSDTIAILGKYKIK